MLLKVLSLIRGVYNETRLVAYIAGRVVDVTSGIDGRTDRRERSRNDDCLGATVNDSLIMMKQER
jgi:hypothetical protein